MSRILLLAYHFPPGAGAGVQRAVKLAKYLPEFGHEVTVVAPAAVGDSRWTPKDDTLLNDLSGTTRIVRIERGQPPRASAWRGRAHRWLNVREAWARWWVEEARAVSLEACADVDAIVATMSPWESATVAARLARELAIPWIADLRDPWALDEMITYPTAAHRRAELGRMRRALAGAAAIVMNTTEAKRALLGALPELETKTVEVIENGFDAEDFMGAAPVREDDAFRIVHAGYLHTALGRSEKRARRIRSTLGGSLHGVDVLTRSHVFLLEAIDYVRRWQPELGSRIELHLAGVHSEADIAETAGHDFVRFHGYLAHDESVALVRSADLLFLPMHDLPRGRRARIVPAKTYEYLASGRPILASVPDGDARDLLEQAAGTFVCRPRNSEAMAVSIVAAAAGTQSYERARSELLAPYERREQARRFGLVLDRHMTRRPRHRVPTTV